MTEAAIVGAVVQALEPAAAQILEDLHAKWSAEITQLEAEAPERIAAAEQAVQDHIGKLTATLHSHLADLDAKRAGASTGGTFIPTATANAGSGAVNPLPNVIVPAPPATKPSA